MSESHVIITHVHEYILIEKQKRHIMLWYDFTKLVLVFVAWSCVNS